MEFWESKPSDRLEYGVHKQCRLPYGQFKESSFVRGNQQPGRMGFVLLCHGEREWQWCHLHFITHRQ